jgi:serine/threonine protein kinase
VIIDKRGNKPRLVDFGLARQAHEMIANMVAALEAWLSRRRNEAWLSRWRNAFVAEAALRPPAVTCPSVMADHYVWWEEPAWWDVLSTSIASSLRSLAGTLPYMAPELFRGSPADIRSDVYSLGVLFFELLTNRLPFESEGLELLAEILHGQPPKPSQLRPGLHPRLEAICLKAMAKKPAKRYQSAAKLVRDLEDYLHPTAWYRRRFSWLARPTRRASSG